MSRNSHFGHDDRTEVSYRASGGKPRKPRNRFGPPRGFDHRGPGSRPRYEDLDGDVEMSAPGASRNPERRFKPYKPNNKKKYKNNRNHNNNNNRVLPLSRILQHSNFSQGTWYKIKIPYGEKLDRNFILKSIESQCRTSFVPFNFQYENRAAMFYVNNFHAAQSIRDLNHQIALPDGYKMVILIQRVNSPISVVNPEVKEAIKACMSRRYDVATHSLNLSKFHEDPGLNEAGFYIPLHKPIVMSAAAKVIIENIPEIQRLDLSVNELYSLERLSDIVPVCKNLAALDLRKNQLKGVNALNSLKGLNLVDINLHGNPLCAEYKEEAPYIRLKPPDALLKVAHEHAVRKKFPKIIRLDGQELPAPITFDLGVETVPPSKGSYFPAQDVMKLVLQFLETYYSIYDSVDREKLLDAYHDQATFSLTVVKPLSQKGFDYCVQEYIPESRNLLRITDSNLRYKLLKQGRLSVVSALAALPQTQHDPNSFTVDISLVSQFLMSFTVCGVFREVGSNYSNAPLRSFSRSFVVSAQGSGFVISNETLSITCASAEQIKAFKFAPPTPSPSPAPSGDKIEEKRLMTDAFSKETGMNVEYSVKCLEEYEWDYHKAIEIFRGLQALGRIPPEAFAK